MEELSNYRTMKTIKLTFLLLISPLAFYAQSLSGLWAGTLSNDSNTIRKDQSFEIVLTQYKEKVYGYSRMTFFVRDTLYYIVKRVKGTIEGEVCQVKDDDIISHNFPHKPEKGVKLISTFRRNQQDSIWYLDGDWKTTETKKHGYYSISGKISLKTETDLEKSKLISHLEELKLADDVAFYKESKKIPDAVAVKDNKQDLVVKEEKSIAISTKETKKEETAKVTARSEPIAEIKQPAKDVNREPVLKDEKPATVSVNEKKKEEITKVTARPEPVTEIKQPAKDINREPVLKDEKPATVSANEKKKEEITKVIAKVEPVTEIKQPAKDINREPVLKNEKPSTVLVNEKKKEEIIKSPPVVTIKEQPKPDPVIETKQPAIVSAKDIRKEGENIPAKPVEQKKEAVAGLTNAEIKKPETSIVTTAVKEKDKQSSITNAPELKPGVRPAAALIAERKMVAPQIVNYKSDSLELSLYDNGEVDGDTVSVLLNGQVILARQGLKASAIKKTIYIPAGNDDSLVLVLYAENLGKYPPNTGLLVVHDGEDVYQIRFTADLQQNAAVIFKRKRD